MYHPDFVTLYVLAASRCIIPSCHIEINPADVSDFELAELFDIKYSRDAIQAMLESGQYQIIGVFDEPWDESLAKEYLSFTDGIREYLGPRFKQTFGLQSRKPPQSPQQPISGNLRNRSTPLSLLCRIVHHVISINFCCIVRMTIFFNISVTALLSPHRIVI